MGSLDNLADVEEPGSLVGDKLETRWSRVAPDRCRQVCESRSKGKRLKRKLPNSSNWSKTLCGSAITKLTRICI
ncbi:hypothetical protein scyTo_0012905 [Scyliorhinus torazame]|uniref:Uncharacterized protein n=1 Tax=Scyliorhinus torazame TaxID=75743 RepID=A0A401NKK3_SCYTO|nr:hypothetical protein [Scyliorhinus torazame]